MKISILRNSLFGCLLALTTLIFACSGSDPVQNAGVVSTTGPIKTLYIAGGFTDAIHIYDSAKTVNGDVAPDRLITGVNTLLSGPYGIAYDSRTDSIFIGNWLGDHVVIYDNVSATTGDVAPSRELVGALTGINRAHDVAIDKANNLLYVAGFHGIAIFANARTIDGDVAPIRLIAGAATLFSGGAELRMHLDTKNDRLYIADPNATPTQVLVFDNISTLDGNVPPDRVIAGTNTTFNYPWGIEVDVKRDILYVGDQGDASVMSFANAGTADGDIAPTRKIQGATSTIVGVSDIFVDEAHDTIYVTDADGNQLLIWEDASQLNGDIAPTRAITGAATGFSYPGSVVGVR